MTRSRIVALTLIGVVALGLAYLKLGSADEAVSVPAGALAGDLILDPCTYSTEDGSYAADCGTLVVPENRADPESRLIALPVTRIKAKSDNPAEPIVRLQGGPGITNMEFEKASRFADDHDVVLVGYRGVDGSSALDCPEVESALKRSTDLLGEKSFRAYADGFRACAARLTDDGVDLAGYSLAQRVDDLEAARKALGYDRIDLVSESVGTRTAMIYAWRYPESIHRSVMIGVNPPGNFLWDPETTNEQIVRYSELCSQDASCSERTDNLAASMRGTAADIPDDWFLLPIKEGNVPVASFYGLMESTMENAPLASPMTLSSWLSADEGDASGFWLQSLLADLFFPGAFVWGEYAAVATYDAEAARDYFSSGGRKLEANLGYATTAFGWGGGRLIDAWPAAPDASEYSRARTSEVETLLIGGALDFATPPQVARKELLPSLPNGRQVVLPGFGHSLDFWTYQPEASSRLITTYLATGEVDDSLYEPQPVDFTPEVTQTALGKGIGGAMVGLALLTVLSLLWMPLRVRRGPFGRKTGATLRSVYPIVLGLGGWFLGVLIVITTMPGVALDDELLAVLSIGVPVGLGIYWAWAHRDWPARKKLVGLAAAVAGALVGGRLGFHAEDDLLALLTAIAGASVGANLALVLLDVLWDRRARVRPVAGDASETLEARPSVG
ncbi:MAG: alpha/beta hydrolase [Gaiellaceae bacterium]